LVWAALAIFLVALAWTAINGYRSRTPRKSTPKAVSDLVCVQPPEKDVAEMTPSDLAYLSEALNHVFRARGDIDCLAFFSGTVVGEQVEWHWIAQDVMGFAPNEIVARQTSTVGSEQGRYTSRESIKIDPADSYRLAARGRRGLFTPPQAR
jgi:hypothetical protein